MTSFFKSLLSNTSKTLKEVGTAPEILTDDGDVYDNIQINKVLQDARIFKEKQLDWKQCRHVMARLVYLINQGERLNETEAENLFFAITKLFQSEKPDLRRMVYLLIKEMDDMRPATSIYVVTATLTKDMNSEHDLYKMNALRLVPIIIEPQYLIQSERFIKQAITDKESAVSNAALVAGAQLYPTNAEFVKKWTNEIQEKLTSKSPATHYHALILMRDIKKNDKNAFLKILVKLTKEGASNDIGSLQLIRFIRTFVQEEQLDQQNEKAFFEYLNRQLHKTSEMVVFEAAKTIFEFKNVPNIELAPCVSVLSVFLNSNSSVSKFAALRIINKLIANPARIPLVSNNTEIDLLIRDNNRSLSAFAISVLLKISKEDAIEQLLSQIQDFINEVSEEFKIDILSSMKTLTAKHPQKYKIILNFLQHCLKNEGKYDFKSAVVSTLEYVIHHIPDSKEIGLYTLVEFIEDCPYPVLHIQIMNLIAREAKNIAQPTKFIRLINNRIILEGQDIRAAAITTLGTFCLTQPSLINQIKPLIGEALSDTDMEVRARALFYMDEIEKIESKEKDDITLVQISAAEANMIEAFLQRNITELQTSDDINALDITQIKDYVKTNNIQVSQTTAPKKKGIQETAVELDNIQNVEVQHNETEEFKKYQALFTGNHDFEGYGELRKVDKEIEVTETSAEYPVKLRKLFFDNYIVLEFIVGNTLEDTAIKNVSVETKYESEVLQTVQVISVKEIKTNTSASVLVSIAKHPEYKIVVCNFQAFLKYTVVEYVGGKQSAEYEDEYQLEDFQTIVSDYLQPKAIPSDKKYEAVWKAFPGVESEASYQLDYKTLESAIKGLKKHFGMSVCESSDAVNMENKVHSLMLSGMYLGYIPVLANCIIGFQAERGCLMKLKVKSSDEEVAQAMLENMD